MSERSVRRRRRKEPEGRASTSDRNSHEEPEGTLYERVIRRAKNHKAVVILLLASTVLVGLAGVADAAGRLALAIRGMSDRSDALGEHAGGPGAVTEDSAAAAARRVLSEYMGVPPRAVMIEDARWVDLVGMGDASEVIVRYRIENADEELALFSTRGEAPQRLFYDDDAALELIQYDGHAYLVASTLEGSGAWLRFTILHWDGAGPLRVAYESLGTDYQGRCGSSTEGST